MRDYSGHLAEAIRHFWRTRASQGEQQGTKSGRKDAGFRSAVTGGKHLDGFADLVSTILKDAGLAEADIHRRHTTLPGYFRPTKEWDLVVVVDHQLVASIEFKAHIGPSFGNNFNNRVEEALGSSTDLLTAYRAGRFKPSLKPWLGWLMLLEKTDASTQPGRPAREPHFPVFDEFREISYAKRYELFCERLMREQLYDATCLVLSSEKEGLQGIWKEPNVELGFTRFAASLLGRASAHASGRTKGL